MTISFRKSFSAALLSGAVAIVTPALAGGLILAQANGSSPNATGSPSAPPHAQPADSAARAAGSNAAGSMNTNNGVTTPGTYGGMGTEPTAPNPGLRNPNGIPQLNGTNGTNPTAPPDPLAKKPHTPPQ